MLGCRVVGIAGSDSKAQFLLDELGFDAVVNYKTAADITTALQEACPNGVDIYFDNVGGNITNNVITLLNRYARVVVCGQISQYNDRSVAPSLNLPFEMWKRSAQMKGFMMHDYERQFEHARSRLLEWLQEGKLRNVEHIIEGFENTPQALIDLFNGENIGKLIVKVANLQNFESKITKG
ncbi:NADPH-dependent curcumin reductase CurA [Paenibacillus sp. V4I7]|nr:NADPH-dependent curcumin reductase CurA [Paenibacillus sp. V4I7]